MRQKKTTQRTLSGLIESNIVLILICMIAIVTHFIYLDKAPNGWHIDEAGAALDAWYIAHFGIDRYGYSYPVLFYNYGGGGQSVLFTYITSVFIKIFGFSLYNVRISAAIMSLMPLMSGIVILKVLNVERRYINVFALVYSVAPYFFMVGRFGLDCNLMLGSSSIFLMCLALAIKYNKKILYFISGVTAGIVLYTYSLSYIVMAIFMILSLCMMLYTKKLTFRKFLCLCLPLGIMGLPLLYEQLNNVFGTETVTIWKFTFVKLGGYRIGDLGVPDIRRIFDVLKSILLYDFLPYNTNARFLTLYWISIPFFFIGLVSGCIDFVKALRKRECNPGEIMLLWFVSEIVMGLMLKKDINANRMNGIFFVVLLYIVYGIWNVVRIVKNEKVVLSITAAIYVFMAIMFFTFYFKSEPNESRIYFGNTFEDLLEDMDSMVEIAGRRVCIEGYYNYYAISRLLINDSAKTREEIESGRYQNGFPEQPEPDMCYILVHTDDAYGEKLYNLGLKVKEYKNGVKLFYP